jgi:type 1 fimbria pilin
LNREHVRHQESHRFIFRAITISFAGRNFYNCQCRFYREALQAEIDIDARKAREFFGNCRVSKGSLALPNSIPHSQRSPYGDPFNGNSMKTKLLAAAAALTALAALTPAAHAQSVDVSVIGTIVPPACVPAISGGGVIDYGRIAASSLSATGFTVLPAHTAAFTINCDAPAKVGVTTVDNRASSTIPGIPAAINAAYNDTYNFGLGTVSGSNVGGYIMAITAATVDGTTVNQIASVDSGTTWSNVAGALAPTAGRIRSWGASAVAGPTAGQVIAGTLTVTAALNKSTELPLSADVPLDGSATLTLVYL